MVFGNPRTIIKNLQLIRIQDNFSPITIQHSIGNQIHNNARKGIDRQGQPEVTGYILGNRDLGIKAVYDI